MPLLDEYVDMNRAITGAWGTAAGAGTGRRTKININSVSPSNVASTSALSLDGTANGTGLPFLPAGSAAAAAAAREADVSERDVLPEDKSTALLPTSDEGIDRLQEGDGATTAGVVKRKARNTLSSTANGVTSASSTKKRKAAAKDVPISGAKSVEAVNPTARLKDLGGVSKALDKILELIAMPLCHPEIYTHTGIKPPRGVLLHGPPGCGKTMLAAALAGDLNVPLLSISSPTIVSGTSGESEQTLRNLFEQAVQMAPCILFLDEIDAITPKRETAQREMERRIVAQLLTCLDDLTWDKTDGRPVMVIGATNRPDSLDPALRRAGRFDHEIALGVPDEVGREEILRILCSSLRLSGDFDLQALAKSTPGYVGADLVALTAAAGIRAVKRIFSELADETRDVQMTDEEEKEGQPAVDEFIDAARNVLPEAIEISTPTTGFQGVVDAVANESIIIGSSTTHAMPSLTLFEALPPSLQTSAIAVFLRSNPSPLSSAKLDRLRITPLDFTEALPSIQPSSKREGFATVPEVTWADIGALEATREELEMTIVEPIKRPELFQSIGVSNSGGVLLWGPPGCGKTLLAKAVANESGANFISVKGPELLNKYVGESERAVRQVFARARTSSPCVIFFDELDALVPRRDDALVSLYCQVEWVLWLSAVSLNPLSSQSESSSRVVNTLLTELDGLEARVQTYVIGATNRPDMIDPAMCRPGRLDKMLYVDLPNQDERIKILHTLSKKTPLAKEHVQQSDGVTGGGRGGEEGTSGVEWLQRVAEDARCEGFSGADLAALVREASVLALREKLREHRMEIGGTYNPAIDLNVKVDISHFHTALDKVQPSVGVSQRKKYNSLRSRLSGFPGGSNSSKSVGADGKDGADAGP